MMTSRERVRRALRFEKPDRAPRDLWALPGVTEGRKAEYEQFIQRFPLDIQSPTWRPGDSGRTRGRAYQKGAFTDDWGVTFIASEDGVFGEVKEPILADWRNLDGFSPPWEYLKEADLHEVDASCRESERFILASAEVRPFERLQFLRGTENLLCDIGYGGPELLRLLRIIHEWEMYSLEMWSKTAVDGISFCDDWGSQTSLLISPKLWREIFKPLYRKYCEIIHEAGKFVFFHSDGHIEAIYEDLVEIGVDAVNSQLLCMNVEDLGSRFQGRITLWGEIDRQHIQPFGTPEEARMAVRRVRAAFDSERGGLIAQCEWGKIDPYENITAIYDEWEKPF